MSSLEEQHSSNSRYFTYAKKFYNMLTLQIISHWISNLPFFLFRRSIWYLSDDNWWLSCIRIWMKPERKSGRNSYWRMLNRIRKCGTGAESFNETQEKENLKSSYILSLNFQRLILSLCSISVTVHFDK